MPSFTCVYCDNQFRHWEAREVIGGFACPACCEKHGGEEGRHPDRHQIRAIIDEYTKDPDAWHRNHSLCPNCGTTNYELANYELTGEWTPLNTVICECRWRGREWQLAAEASEDRMTRR